MKVVEIHGGIAGEGLMTGKPTTFIRFAGCNLKCTFCDTPYHRTETNVMTVEEILDKICAVLCDNITFTGGEPFIQDKKEMLELIERIHAMKKKVFVETNGVIFDKDYWKVIDFFSISPKLVSSGNPKLNYVLGVGQYLRHHFVGKRDHAPQMQLKFVIKDDKDLAEVKTFLDCGPSYEHDLRDSTVPIIFQPCTDYDEDITSYQTKAAKLVERIQNDKDFYDYDFRVMLQQHVVIFGSKRGV